MSFFLPGTSIEIANPDLPRGPKPFVLFDFDGTLSLIREGWQGVMIPMMVELLEPWRRPEETPAQIEELVREFVTVLTGKQTIYQMMRLAEEISARGGRPQDPLEYKYLYLDRLWERIRDRVAGLGDGTLSPEDLLVPGSRELLENLAERGATLFIASGTDEPYVLQEAAALGVDRFAPGRIYGALDDYTRQDKGQIIERILAENDLHGSELLGFGDGYVEIDETRRVGGVAVGVATDEKRPGELDEWKRERLLSVGADVIVPDFREHAVLLGYLWGEI